MRKIICIFSCCIVCAASAFDKGSRHIAQQNIVHNHPLHSNILRVNQMSNVLNQPPQMLLNINQRQLNIPQNQPPQMLPNINQRQLNIPKNQLPQMLPNINQRQLNIPKNQPPQMLPNINQRQLNIPQNHLPQMLPNINQRRLNIPQNQPPQILNPQHQFSHVALNINQIPMLGQYQFLPIQGHFPIYKGGVNVAHSVNFNIPQQIVCQNRMDGVCLAQNMKQVNVNQETIKEKQKKPQVKPRNAASKKSTRKQNTKPRAIKKKYDKLTERNVLDRYGRYLSRDAVNDRVQEYIKDGVDVMEYGIAELPIYWWL